MQPGIGGTLTSSNTLGPPPAIKRRDGIRRCLGTPAPAA
jgi:hypothetical protein